jgi:hypothetical protein
MKAQVISNYRNPQYPSKKQVQEQPQLLRRCVSTRWQKLIDAGLSGALMAGISLTGCQEESTLNPALTGGGQVGAIHNPDGTTTTTGTQTKKLTALVAPIFEHGEGRGVTGCVVIAPATFISEEEAIVIIKEELAKNGITIDKDKVLLEDIKIKPGTFDYAALLNLKKEEQPNPLEVDLQDSTKSINIEYVSQEDYHNLGGARSMSTAKTIDTKNVARQVRNQIQADTKQGIFGVFYDPIIQRGMLVKPEDEKIPTADRFKAAQEQSKTEAREMLRQQVQDFANWLKEQKVI